MNLLLIISILLFDSSREYSLYLNFHYTNNVNDATTLLLEDNLSEPVVCELINYFYNDKNKIHYLLDKYRDLNCSIDYFYNNINRYNIYQLEYLEFLKISNIILIGDDLRDFLLCLNDFPNNLWNGDQLCLKNCFFYLPLFHLLRYSFFFR
ncbi:hypothetical protein JXR93_06275 [bacterium]|nr:hypothetical protein [bacterium]